MKITVLSENRKKGKCDSEFGFSLHIKFGEHEFLFDVGNSRLFLENAGKLGVDVNKVNTLILSHGHLDHVGGLTDLPCGKRIIAHPAVFKRYFSTKAQAFKSCPVSQDELLKCHDVNLSKAPCEVFEGVYFIGEVPRNVPFEGRGNLVGTLDAEGEIPDLREEMTRALQ